MAEEKSHENKEHHHENKEHYPIEHKKHSSSIIKKTHVWKFTAALAILLLIASVMTGGFRGNKDYVTGIVSAEEAAQNTISYINANLLQQGTSATLKNVSESGGVYSIGISIGGQDYTSYVTQDGKILFTTGIDMTQKVEKPTDSSQPTQNIQKSDKPEVELFVMSHCPFGTQAEKGIIPAVKALGDSINFKLRFVYYVMHGEKEVNEQTREYCIQKEQNDKFLDYLGCFLKEGKGEECLTEAKIDTEQMKACIEEADEEFEISVNLEDKSQWLNERFPLFNTNAELNLKYGVGGSPTLVINGAKASSSRDSASYLSTICAHFNEAPKGCNEELSSAPPSPGFGYSESGVATDEQC